MEIKSKSKIDELAKSGNLKEAIKEANNSGVNMVSEGIRRVDLHKIDNNNSQQSDANGFLIIDSGNKEGDNQHIALKAKKDTFWTISVANDGASLNIGQFKVGETEIKPIIDFKEDQSMTLYEPLGVNELKPVDEVIRGITTSGFKGFKTGIVKADGHWHSILEIPKETFGKYKLEAWVVSKEGKGISNLEYTFVFFSDKFPKKAKKESFENLNWFKKLLLKFTHRLLRNRQEILELDYGENFQYKRALQESSKLKVDLKKTEKREIQLCIKTKYTPKNCKIYYSIERIWEGNDWINVENKNIEPLEEQLEEEQLDEQLEEQPIQ